MPEVRSRRAQRRFVNLPVLHANQVDSVLPADGGRPARHSQSLSVFERLVNRMHDTLTFDKTLEYCRTT